MSTSTYSFLDLAGAIAHPTFGAYLFTGAGVGEVNVTMATERTAHDTAADGSVMISKIAGNSGQISIQAQQTSDLHKWLLDWYNYLVVAPVSAWGQTAATLRNASDGTSHTASGISPQKVPDKPYQAQGQKVTWVLMCADVQSITA